MFTSDREALTSLLFKPVLASLVIAFGMGRLSRDWSTANTPREWVIVAVSIVVTTALLLAWAWRHREWLKRRFATSPPPSLPSPHRDAPLAEQLQRPRR